MTPRWRAIRGKFRRKPRPPHMTWTRQALAAAVPVAVVALIAGVVSYGHIETLALSVHQPLDAARLLPGAVDFLIVAGSVILLAGSALGWLCVVAGVAATLFANVESGLPYGPLGATVAAWPAVAFTVATFVLERWLRSCPDEASGALASPGASESTGTMLPVPAPARETELSLPASGGVARRRRGPVSAVDEDALLAKVLEAGVVPPSYRAWSFEETGMYRSAGTKRVYDLARERLGPVAAVRNGADEERAAMNGAGHGD